MVCADGRPVAANECHGSSFNVVDQAQGTEEQLDTVQYGTVSVPTGMLH